VSLSEIFVLILVAWKAGEEGMKFGFSKTKLCWIGSSKKNLFSCSVSLAIKWSIVLFDIGLTNIHKTSCRFLSANQMSACACIDVTKNNERSAPGSTDEEHHLLVSS
jgi:hypothetical protein